MPLWHFIVKKTRWQTKVGQVRQLLWMEVCVQEDSENDDESDIELLGYRSVDAYATVFVKYELL